MGKFITLREEFTSETGAHPFADQQYIEWLEKVVERQRQVKNCSIPFVGQIEQLRAFKHFLQSEYNLPISNRMVDEFEQKQSF